MAGALDGIRVIDFGQYLAGPMVAMMLADNGADVIRIDPPGGPRWQSDANAVLQRGKRSLVLDLKRAEDLETVRRLTESADVVIENFRPGVMDRLGLGHDALIAANPRLVYCSIPGFASDDPRAQVAAYEGVVGAAAGIYTPSSWNPTGDPVFNALPLCSSFASIIAARSIVAALIARERDGHGQWIEVPLFDSTFELLGSYAEKRPGQPQPVDVSASRWPIVNHFECADGKFVHLSWLEKRQVPRFLEKFLPDLLAVDGITLLDRIRTTPELAAELQQRLTALFKTKTASEWDHIANPDSDLAECQTTEEWLTKDQHARDSGAVISLTDPELGQTEQAGYPVTLKKTPPHAAGPRRALDADRADILAELASRPMTPAPAAGRERLKSALEGVRALDVTQVLAGPTACRILAEYGAEVIRVQNPFLASGNYHAYTNSGKRTIILDLKTEGGREALQRLARQVDVISTNFTPEGATALGISDEQVRKYRPDVVYSVITAFGLDGWRSANKGHEQLGQAVTGMQVRWGKGFSKPIMQRWLVNDFGTGNLAAFAILLGLFHKVRTGEGQMVGASLAQTSTLHQLPFMLSYRGKVWDEPAGQQAQGWGPLCRLYKASDRWFFLAAEGSDALQRLAKVEGLEDVAPAESADLEVRLSERFASAEAAVWVERLTAAGLGAHAVVEFYNELMEDAWVKSHQLSVVREFEGVGPVRTVGPAPRLSGTPVTLLPPALPAGCHSREVFAEIGLADRIEEWLAKGFVSESEKTPVRR